MNDYYAGYDEKYPDLIIKILESVSYTHLTLPTT